MDQRLVRYNVVRYWQNGNTTGGKTSKRRVAKRPWSPPHPAAVPHYRLTPEKTTFRHGTILGFRQPGQASISNIRHVYKVWGDLLQRRHLRLLMHFKWEGDRVILIGDYTINFPPAVLSAAEQQEWLMNDSPYDWISETFKGEHGGLSPTHDTGNKAILNLSNHEYIRGDHFNSGGQHPTMHQVILSRISWSHDPSMSMQGPTLWNYGTWAGSRLAIADIKECESNPRYKDITETVFYEIYEVYELDDPHERCDCYLCTKFREMKNNKFDPYEEPESSISPVMFESNTSLQTCQSTLIHRPFILPAEVRSLIFVDLPSPSLAACALVCRAFTSEATRLLYRNVSLHLPEYTETFSKTLLCDPLKKVYIRRLSIQLKIEAAYRKYAHEILRELPNLTHLEFSPCWITYGDMAVHEYPFRLHTLFWGLIPDVAMNLFLRSQPSIEALEFSHLYGRLSDWFEFWPHLLPNLKSVTGTLTMVKALNNLEAVENGSCQVKLYAQSYDGRNIVVRDAIEKEYPDGEIIYDIDETHHGGSDREDDLTDDQVAEGVSYRRAWW